MKTHMFISSQYSRAGKTACGIVAWPAKESDTEAETTFGSRIDITRDFHAVDCFKCKKIAGQRL